MADRNPQQDEHVIGRFDQEISYRAIFLFMSIIALVTIGAFVLMWWMGNGLREDLARRDEPMAPSMAGQTMPVPPEPHLQTEPYADWDAMLEAYHTHLATYDWVDREVGKVRVPIADAMEVVARQGLPRFPAYDPAADAASGGLSQ